MHLAAQKHTSWMRRFCILTLVACCLFMPYHALAAESEPESVHPVRLADADSMDHTKKIVISLSTQSLLAYEGAQVVYKMPVTTGSADSPTLQGEFTILDKVEEAESYWNFTMPHWLGLYYVYDDAEDGIHGLPLQEDGTLLWGDSLGKEPVTDGCVVVSLEDAATLYTWADVGTVVDIVE